ncbi:MAG: ABC transporter ATP-binding protein [Sporichthyaceae bacterium]|nr:ABC transporter ATP-binding protein [Sporichthyaceae bacterium]
MTGSTQVPPPPPAERPTDRPADLSGGGQPALAATDLVVTVGSARLLAGVSIHAASGEWLAVIGPNGAGKSTLCRALTGLLTPASGSVTLVGRPAAELTRRDRARQIAYVPQAPVIPPGVTAADYVLLGRTPHLRPLGMDGTADRAAVQAALERLDVLRFADRPLSTLSGGERQRVLVARALAQAAPIVLLDEPTTALDVGAQQDVLELIDSLRHEVGLTVLTTLHDLTLAGQYADRLVLLNAGVVAAQGSATEVLTEENIERYYGARMRVVMDHGRPLVLPVRGPVPVRRRSEAG